MTKPSVGSLLCAAMVAFTVPASSQVRVGGVTGLSSAGLDLTVVEDSATYLVYRFEGWNAAASSWGAARFKMALTASSGTPQSLPATGSFGDFTTSPRPNGRLREPYPQIGPISPGDWSAGLIDGSWFELE